MVLMNWMLPDYEPGSLMGGEEKTDGTGYSIIICGKLAEEAKKELGKRNKGL